MKFSMGKVFGLCLSVMGKQFWPLVVVTAIVNYLLPLLGFLALVVFDIFARVKATSLLGAALVAIMLVCWVASWNALTDITLAHAAERPIRIRSVLRKAAANILPVLLLGVIGYLGVIVGLVLLIVPAILFMVMFLVTVPAYIEEKPGILGAFGRSRALTKGHRWGIFGMSLLVNIAFYIGMLIVIVAARVIGQTMSPGEIGGPGGLLTPLLMVIGIGLVSLPLPVVNTAFYIVLRTSRGERLTGLIEKIFE